MRAGVTANPEHGSARTVPRESLPAPDAPPAGEVDLADHAFVEPRGLGRPFDDPYELVSGNAREAVVPAPKLQIRIADSGEADADEREAGAEARNRDVPNVGATRFEDQRLHAVIVDRPRIRSRVVTTDQLDLFRPPSLPRTASQERLERERAECAEIAARLPAGLFFGTSSWSFPDWEGIVYSGRFSTAELARDGLTEYIRHPLLTTVGIDRSYYAPISRADLERYAEQLPAGFPCCAKAPESVTAAALGPRAGAEWGRRNPDFLSPGRFLEDMATPFAESFLEHTAPFLFQFPPAPAHAARAPDVFAIELEQFLAALPRRFRYAVELREERLLSPAYRDALAAHGAAHIYNFAGPMPMLFDQELVVPIETADFVVIRLLLPPGRGYAERRDELSPFDRISSPQLEMRRQVVDLTRRALDMGRTVTVLVNNKAEGCSPLTIRALAEMLAEEL